jgi:hypothetical protein
VGAPRAAALRSSSLKKEKKKKENHASLYFDAQVKSGKS